jgi:superoxide dismutase
MNRITEKHLQAVVDRLNRVTNSPAEAYRTVDGQTVGNVGNYHLSHAYGGVCLHRMHNEGGGVSSPLSTGHVTKRELSGLLHAFINGIETVTA